MNEITEALNNQKSTWRFIAQGGNYYGLGNTQAEAMRNWHRSGGDRKGVANVGRFHLDGEAVEVHVVVDFLGRVYWDSSEVELEWLGETTLV